MPDIKVILRDGQGRTISVATGLSLMEALRDNGVDEILAICGGCCSCATCHVYVDAEHFGSLSAISEDENDLLDIPERRATSRLSCQVPVAETLDGMTVTVAPAG